MQTRRTLIPGQKGTTKFLDRYGEKLCSVRYRYDKQRGKRFTTVEFIVEESAYAPPSKLKSEAIVGLCIALTENVLQKKVRQAGSTWNRNRQLWEIRYDRVMELGLEERIESNGRSINKCLVVSRIHVDNIFAVQNFASAKFVLSEKLSTLHWSRHPLTALVSCYCKVVVSRYRKVCGSTQCSILT